MARRKDGLTRAEFLKAAALGAAGVALAAGAEAARVAGSEKRDEGRGTEDEGGEGNRDQGTVNSEQPEVPAGQGPATGITIDDLKAFAKVAGLKFTDAELAKVKDGIDDNLTSYEALRTDTANYELFPPAPFRVFGAENLKGSKVQVQTPRRSLKKPSGEEDLAFMTVADLAHLVKTRQVTSVELTELAIKRLKRYGPKLVCVAELTEERAMRMARQADEEIAQGRYRGPLHGIPCGVKDLFAAKGYPTQWGTEAFKGQVIDHDSAVVERLDRAGAVLCGKLSLGALAMDDNWYEGRTKNPWKPTQGSSGSSAGSAASVAAGLLPFAIGTETSGSIVSPSHRCRVTGLRPTFGSVSRYGAMALCWTLDKVGVLAHTAEDAALVFATLVGEDERDNATVKRPFAYKPLSDLAGVNIGVLGRPLAKAKEALEALGAKTSAVKAPQQNPGLWFILSVESAAMFDEITRNGRLDLVKENGWPEYWRSARFVTAVEYAQAERARTLLMRDFEKAFGNFDAILMQDHGGGLIYPANLAGWPQVLVPMGANAKGEEVSVSLLARPFEEGKILAIADLLQRKLPFYRERPNMGAIGA